MLTAAYLINRTPMPLLSNSSLFGHDFDYTSLRVFGCLAYASTMPLHRTKFDPRAHPCIFMDYPAGVKGYRLYDITKKQFFVSRDVLFFEDLFPFHTLVPADGSSITNFLADFVLPAVASDPISASLFPDTLFSTPDIDTADVPAVFNTEDESLVQQQPSDTVASLLLTLMLMAHLLTLVWLLPLMPNVVFAVFPSDGISGGSQHDSSVFAPATLDVSRRSHRPRHPPSYLKDFHCNLL